MFKCKKCGVLVEGEHTEKEIFDVGKLCPSHRTEANQLSLRRQPLVKSKQRQKASRKQVRQSLYG